MRRSLAVSALAGLVVGAGFALVPAMPADALNQITVTTTAPTGPGSLAAAFTEANTDGDTSEIVLAAGATYQFASPECATWTHTENNPLTITGNGATLAGTQSCGEGLVTNTAATSLTLAGLTLSGGIGSATAPVGAAVTSAGPVTISSSLVRGNDGFAGAGAVYSAASVNVTNTTFRQNLTAFFPGGAISAVGPVTVTG